MQPGAFEETGERRREERVPRRRSVRVDPGGTDALTGDISPGGVFVLTARVREPGTRVRLTFSTANQQVQAEGVVRWVRARAACRAEPGPIGMGIEFVAPEGGWGSPAGGNGHTAHA